MIKRNKKILIIMAMAIAMLTTGCTSDKAVVEKPLKEIASEGELDTNECWSTIIDEDGNLIREDGELKRCESESEEVKYTKEHILVTDIEFLDEKLTEPNEKGEVFYQFKVKNNSKFVLSNIYATTESGDEIYVYSVLKAGETSNEYKIPVENIKKLDDIKLYAMRISMIDENYEIVTIEYNFTTEEYNVTSFGKLEIYETPQVKVTDLEFVDEEIKTDETTGETYIKTKIKNNSDKVIDSIYINFENIGIENYTPLKPGETSEFIEVVGYFPDKLEFLNAETVEIITTGDNGEEIRTGYVPKLGKYFKLE